ncbi:ribonuclease H-like domain-containing protein, partial [Tanacetum coccineum]
HVPAGSSTRPAPVSAGRPFSAGWRNHAARPMTRPTSHYFQHFSRLGCYNQLYMDKGRWGTAVKTLAVVNKEKLDDFVKIIGGTVTFGGGDGKITGKGTIRTSKLNFENVYYVEELQNFNLFSVSQICDKKNKVLFTDKECLVLSKEFQLPENSQVVLRVPRRHNLYTFNLTEIQPKRDINCLLAKASSDESTKWHRRMAHVNFKNINKLAKHGLVNGLPFKLFTNDHNCVACNKGKQHKASYKGLCQEWYFDLDYLTDSLGYTRFKTNQPADYVEELARLQKQAYKANAIAEKHLSQADLATSRNTVPAGKVVSAAGVTDSPTDPSTLVVNPVHTAEPSLPPGLSLGSSENSSRYLSPSDLANSMSSFSEIEDIYHHLDTGIFSSSSYDADFGSTVTNLAPSVVVDSIPTKRVNTIHP